MPFDPLPNDPEGQIGWLVRAVGELHQRERNRSRDGKIVGEDPENGLYQVELREAEGDDDAFVTDWIPVEALSSGALKIQGEPTMGQPVTVKSESGDMTDAIIALSSFSDEHKRPHDKNGEFVLTLGGLRQHIDKDGDITITSPSGHLN